MTDSEDDPRVQALLAASGAASLEDLVAARYGFSRPRINQVVSARLLDALGPDAPAAAVETAIVEATVIGETYFLRHRQHLDWLASSWLPTLAHRIEPVNILFAGCSTGEEVWSFLGTLGPRLRALPGGARVLALDISERALQVARARRYGRWSLRGVDLERVAHWLTVDDDGTARVSARLTDGLRFVQRSLLDPLDDLAPPGGFDLILCRNVLLYLDPEALDRAWANLFAVLGDDAPLLSAATDPAPREGGRRRWHGPVPVHRHRPKHPAPPPARPGARTTPGRRVPPKPRAPSDQVLAEHFARTGQEDVARSLLRQSLADEPEDVAALVLMAMLASEAGDHDAAITAGRQAVYLAPEAPYPAYVMALALRRAGRHDAARRRLAAVRAMLQSLSADAPLAHSDGLVVRQLLNILEAP